MKTKYIIKLALKNLEFHKLRSLLTLEAVAVGVGFTVFLISIGYGLQMISIGKIADLNSSRILDVTSTKPQEVKINDDAIKEFKSLGGVSQVAPQVSIGGKIKYKTSEVDSVVYGKNLDFLDLEDMNLERGRLYSSDQAKEVLVTTSALKMLGFKDYNKSLGKTVTIETVIPAQLLSSKSDKSVEKKQKCKIVGVLRDEKVPYVYASLNLIKAQGVVSYSGAKVKVKESDRVEIVRKQIQNMDYKAESNQQTIEQANQIFSILKSILLGVGLIAIFVAYLGMFNTLTISLLERGREIGIMKALGANSKDIQRLFLAEALCLGLIGCLEGLTLALAGGGLINLAIEIMAKSTGNLPVKLFYAPILVLFISFVFALMVSFFTGVYPARRAANTNPLDALRYE